MTLKALLHGASAKTQNAQKLTADSRRFTQMDTERNPFKNITAEAQRAQRIKFLFVGRPRQTKHYSNQSCKFLPNCHLPIGQKGFPLRLCGEMSEFLSAIIGENLRLRLFPDLAQPKADPSSGGVLAFRPVGPTARRARKNLLTLFC